MFVRFGLQLSLLGLNLRWLRLLKMEHFFLCCFLNLFNPIDFISCSRVCSRDVTLSWSHLKVWDRWFCFQGGSLTWVASWCCQLTSVPHSKDLCIGTLECPHDIAAGFPQSEWCKRARQSNNVFFYDLASEVTLCHFCNILLGTQVSTTQRRNIQGYKCQEVRITRGHRGLATTSRYQLKLTKPLFTEPLFVSSFYTNMK